jgi:hypothetical protein
LSTKESDVCHEAGQQPPEEAHDAALADSEQALKDAREIGQAAILMYIPNWASTDEAWAAPPASAETQPRSIIPIIFQNGVAFWSAKATSSSPSVSACVWFPHSIRVSIIERELLPDEWFKAVL